MFGDPPARRQLADLGAFQPTPGRVVEGFEEGVARPQFRFQQGPRQATILTSEPLRIDEEGQSLIKRERRNARVLLLGLPGGEHPVEFHRTQFLDGRTIQHR